MCRNAGECVPSYCSLLHNIYTKTLTPALQAELQYDEHIMQVLASTLEVSKAAVHTCMIVYAFQVAMKCAEEHPEQVLFQSMYDMVKDPVSAVQDISAFAGIEFDEKARDKLNCYIEQNKKDKRAGGHKYSASDFKGLSQEKIQASFKRFHDRHELHRTVK